VYGGVFRTFRGRLTPVTVQSKFTHQRIKQAVKSKLQDLDDGLNNNYFSTVPCPITRPRPQPKDLNHKVIFIVGAV
jgi:hypothetical protein